MTSVWAGYARPVLVSLLVLTLSAPPSLADEGTARVDPVVAPAGEDVSPAGTVAATLTADRRLTLRPGPAEPPPSACFKDHLCLSRLADEHGARLVFFGVQPKEQDLLLIGAYDVRRGKLLSRPVPKQNLAAVQAGTELLVGDILGTNENLPAVFVGVQQKQEVAGALDVTIPWVLYGAALVAGGGAVAGLGALTLVGVSVYRSQQAAALPDGAGDELEREAAIYALAALMTTLFAGGLFLFSVMGATYYAFDALGWAEVRPIE